MVRRASSLHAIRALIVILLAAAALGGCGESVAPDDAAGTPTAGDDAPAPTSTATADLYADFAECEPLPEQEPYEAPAGMIDLGEFWVEQVSETPPLTTVTGLVGATPLEMRDQFASDEGVELVYVEDEGFEVEILIDVEGRRTFLKGTIRCRTGSVFAQIIGPEGQADLLPVPGQQADQ